MKREVPQSTRLSEKLKSHWLCVGSTDLTKVRPHAKMSSFFKWLTGKTKLSLENLIGHHMSFKVVSIFKIPISSKSDKDENWLVMNGKN